MKLQTRQIAAFLKSPDKAARAILVYGPDAGLVRERAALLGKTIVADLSDPFNVALLTTAILLDDPARLSDEASAISMMGGDRLIRIEQAEDKLAPLLKEYLKNPSRQALIVCEAGELPTRSPLRQLFERSDNAAALPCYVEGERDIAALIREVLQADGHSIAPDAANWLAGQLVGDRSRARAEAEKLSLYLGLAPAQASLTDVQACCGLAGDQSMDDLIYGTASGRTEAALRAYGKLTEEGTAFIGVLRALQNHFRRLHAVRARTGAGDPLDLAMKSLSPPVFFKWEQDFRQQAGRWSLPALETALARLAALEAQCKQTGAPAETLCAQAILAISKAA